jgi:hypothetical protein
MKSYQLSAAIFLVALLLFAVLLFARSSSKSLPFVSWPGPIECCAEEAYINARSIVLQKYQEDLPLFLSLLARSYENPAVAGDDAWLNKMHSVAQKIQRHGQQLRRLEPPASMMTSHKELMSYEHDQTECATHVLEELRIGDNTMFVEPSLYCGRAADGVESFVDLMGSGQPESSQF